jgi:hypothetical protein
MAVSPYAQTVADGGSIPNDNTFLRHTNDGNYILAENAGQVAPIAIHTYNSFNYLAPADGGDSPLGSIVLGMMESTGGKITVMRPYRLNLNTKVWTRGPIFPFQVNSGGILPLHNSMCWDSVRRVFWHGGGESRNLNRVDLTNNVVTEARGTFGNYVGSFMSEAFLVYHPGLDILIGGSQGTDYPLLWGIDLSTSPTATSSVTSLTRHQITQANTTQAPYYSPGNLPSQHGWAEFVGNDMYMVMPTDGQYGSGLPAIHRLTPPTPLSNWKTSAWTWSKETLSGQSGETANLMQGDFFSKVRYVPALKCLIYSTRSDYKAVAARHSSWV